MFVSFSALEKDMSAKIKIAEDKMIDFVKDKFNNEVAFKKTYRDEKEIKLDTKLVWKKSPNSILFSITGSKVDISFLKEDEIGVGSKGVPPKATVLKLKNDIRFYMKSIGGSERT